MRAIRALSPLILFIALAGCGEQRLIASALDSLGSSASRLVLYSLDPEKRHGYTTHNDTVFHGFGILGHAEITDPAERQGLMRALAQGVRTNDGTVAACFRPRHALHIEHEGQLVDLTICFECLSVSADGFNEGNGFATSRAPEEVFDAALRRHHLPKSTDEA